MTSAGPSFALAVLCGLLAVTAVLAQEGPPLPVEPGDVLSVTVIDEPGLSREVKVDALGRIMLPRIGGVDIGGKGVDQIRQEIEANLSGKEILVDPQVIVEVARYRPFYVGGSVAQQGAIPFEPGLTVRHALLLAGGVKAQDEPEILTATELLALNAEWRAKSFALLEVNSRIARLEAELEHRAEATPPAAGAHVAPEDAARVTTLDSALLADRLEIRSADQAHLQDLMQVTEVELDVLSRQAAHQQRESELQEDEVESARALLDKGLISQPRVRELEREHLQLSRSILEVQAYTARARQNKETLGYTLEAADRTWRIETRARLREAMLEREELQSEAELMVARLLAAGVRLTGADAPAVPEPEVVIHRNLAGESRAIEAGMDTRLLPGDILDVSLPVPRQG